MTLKQATEKAREESKNGYVQHVNTYEYEHAPGIIHYLVSDWYDSERTVISFENGREL